MKLLIALAALTACTRPARERAEDEFLVGNASLSDVTVDTGGLAAVRDLSDRKLDLWSQSPDLDVTMTIGSGAAGAWRITARNTLRDAIVTIDGGVPITRIANGDPPTIGTFDLALDAGTHHVRIAPPDADTIEPYRVASMADIQKALPIVDDVFKAIDAVPDARFVVSMGDITQRSELDEYDQFDRQLATLDIPYYTTLGNHELWADHNRFFDRYGRASFQFTFKGVSFTFADSGDAGIDPIVDAQIVDWLAAAKSRVSIFLTHIPPIDPVGIRDGSFRSAEDGHRLISELVTGQVDLALYGHIHTYKEWSHAGIPAYISGGGGADPMKWDGIDRHFLMVELHPETGTIGTVEVHRVADRE